MRMSFSEPLPSKRTSASSLLFRLSGGVYRNVAYQTIGALDTHSLYKHYNFEIYPTFLNVDNVSEDIYELDEINVNPGNQGSPIIF
jgi:hypothetical protein